MIAWRASVCWVWLGACSLLCACSGGGDSAPPVIQPVSKISVQVLPQSAISGNRFVLYAPDDDRLTARPLVIFLHGFPPGGNVSAEGIRSDYIFQFAQESRLNDMLIAAPVANLENVHHPLQTDAVIREVQRQYTVDPARIYLVGYSMGGRSAWTTALTYPKRFAAVVPIAGGFSNEEQVQLPAGQWAPLMTELVGTPIRAYHSQTDEIVPYAEGKNAFDAFVAAGGTGSLITLSEGQTHYPGAVTSSITAELFDWLRQQSRPNASEQSLSINAPEALTGTYTGPRGSITVSANNTEATIDWGGGNYERYSHLGSGHFARFRHFTATINPNSGLIENLCFPALGWSYSRNGFTQACQ